MHTKPFVRAAGFSLTELAIVMVIVALLIGGMLVPFTAQRENQVFSETQKTLATVQEALLGYAAANGRLPCPAADTNSGNESPPGGGACTSFYGYVPAATLGLSNVTTQGMLLDGWGFPIRYAVASNTISGKSNPFTTPNGMRNATISAIGATPYLLSICNTSTGIQNIGSANARCASSPSDTTLSNTAVAVLWSTGKNSATAGTGNDEMQNPNDQSTIANDPVFVYHPPTPSDAANGEFDDLVTWLSPNLLFNRMITAGQLP